MPAGSSAESGEGDWQQACAECGVREPQCHTEQHLHAGGQDGLHFVTPRHTVVPTTKPRVAVTLDAEVYEEIKAIAKAENRSLANLIESWVLDELAARKAKK